MAVPPESSVKFQVDCDPDDPLYKELSTRVKREGGEMQFLGNMVVEIYMLPKDSKDPSQSR